MFAQTQSDLYRIKNHYELTHGQAANSSAIEIGWWQQAYEAVIAASVAINRTLQTLSIDTVDQLHSKLQTTDFMRILYESFDSVRVLGFTGPLRFRDGDRIATFVVDQVRMQTLQRVVHVAYLVAEETNISWVEPVKFPTLPESAKPQQFAPEVKRESSKTYMTTVYVMITGGTLILTIVCGTVVVAAVQRRVKRKLLKELYSMQWKVDFNEIVSDAQNIEKPESSITTTENQQLLIKTDSTPMSSTSSTLGEDTVDNGNIDDDEFHCVAEVFKAPLAKNERKISALSNDSGVHDDHRNSDDLRRCEKNKDKQVAVNVEAEPNPFPVSLTGTYRGTSIQLMLLKHQGSITSSLKSRERLLEVKTVSDYT